ncbi:hypothetical protein WJX72_005572 [[Myrmecia] bisecta]|uniref:Uncharacterized protein n=1 Tax=[Myrmecia] bisecta TaxID=41462 RepID=A0AAW1P5M3_9CHLO
MRTRQSLASVERVSEDFCPGSEFDVFSTPSGTFEGNKLENKPDLFNLPSKHADNSLQAAGQLKRTSAVWNVWNVWTLAGF